MEELNKQALRILRLFGDTRLPSVTATGGPEQEYFLIDKECTSSARTCMCGRTLFGAKPPKGQELDDHYFGAIKPRVSEFMKDLDTELWKLGVLSQDQAQRGGPLPARDGPHLLRRQQRLRPQPAGTWS
jgi:glutamine synthetase